MRRRWLCWPAGAYKGSSKMSEPVTNAEIEDVLSSIRRLVSENAGAGHRTTEIAEKVERLVLTPAFRVDDGPEAGFVEEDGDEIEPGPMGEVVTLGAAQRVIATPVTSDTGPEAEDATLESRIAELEAAVDSSAGEWEPDGSEDDPLPDQVMFHHGAAEPVEAAPGAAEAPVSLEAAMAAEVARGLGAWMHEAAEVAIDESVAALGADPAPEAPMVEIGDWEVVGDDEPEAGGYDGEVFAEIDAAETAPAEEAGEAVIDEDTLRDMVTRMVREELQGPVGERITHNVRRMVRREIARALSLQDFE